LGEELRSFEAELVFRDGGSVVGYGNATPLRDGAASVTGAVRAFIDITELRETERALRAGQERFGSSIDDPRPQRVRRASAAKSSSASWSAGQPGQRVYPSRQPCRGLGYRNP
jgi:hypothetical protein